MTSPPRRQPGRPLVATVIAGAVVAAVGAAAADALVQHVPKAAVIACLQYALGLVGVVWLFSLNVYNRLSDVTDLPGLDHRQHSHLEMAVRARLQWFWVRALFLGLLALTMVLPSLLAGAGLAPPRWAVAAAGGALCLALFSLRRLWHELEDIRALRSRIKELERREQARAQQLARLKDRR